MSGMSQSRLNGKRGIILETERPSGLFPVAVDLEFVPNVRKEVGAQARNCTVIAHCAHCGTTRVASQLQICSGCVVTRYCSWDCQNAHWDLVHGRECGGPAMSCAVCDRGDGGANPPLLHCGCGCDAAAGAGLAHVACRARVAAYRGPGFHKEWTTCSVCSQDYTGEMQLGLAKDLTARLKREGVAAGSPDRDSALALLGTALDGLGAHSVSEKVWWEVLRCRRAGLGHAHDQTLKALFRVTQALQRQGKHAQAEPLLRKALATREQQDGAGGTGGAGGGHAGSAGTLWIAAHLVTALVDLGAERLAEAEALCSDTCRRATTWLGAQHAVTVHARRQLSGIHTRLSKGAGQLSASGEAGVAPGPASQPPP